jgi:hypothetical protein
MPVALATSTAGALFTVPEFVREASLGIYVTSCLCLEVTRAPTLSETRV